MYPYFCEIETQLISEDTRARLIEIGLKYGESTKSVTDPAKEFGKYWVRVGLTKPNKDSETFQQISDIQEIKDLWRKFAHKSHGSNLVYMLPTPGLADKARRHIDDRHCSVVIPLWPVGDSYASTTFWKDMSNDTPLASRGYGNGMPFLMNTKILHSISHYDCMRFNFQFSITETFQTTLNSMHAGTFFKI